MGIQSGTEERGLEDGIGAKAQFWTRPPTEKPVAGAPVQFLSLARTKGQMDETLTPFLGAEDKINKTHLICRAWN